jgi:anti-sigma factor RsiW
MNTTAAVHPVAPEEIMAFLDGELSAAHAQAVAIHLDGCPECKGLAEQFRGLSRSLSQWSVPTVPLKLEEAVNDYAVKTISSSKGRKLSYPIRSGIWSWKSFAVGGVGAVAGILLLVGISVPTLHLSERAARPMASVATQQSIEPETERYANTATRRPSGMMNNALAPPSDMATRAPGGGVAGIVGGLVESPATPAPMIARTASLTITVKDIAAARSLLDAMLAKHQGYSAQLTVESAANAPRGLQASLRIPVPGLSAAIADLKTLGRVEKESQSGEDVTQQHVDLAERLKTARETEERFRGILQQHTGTVADLLQVEEEIARVRGEIESMEAEQTALEHRVDFATVDLQLSEEYKAEIISPTASFGPRLHHAFVEGYRNASETVVGIFLFVIEYGPSILIWITIILLPIFFIWRRHRKARSRM